MPVFMKYDGVDGQFSHADRFDFSQLTTEPPAPEHKPSLIVKFDIGGPPLSLDAEYVLTGIQDGSEASPTGRTDGVFTVVLPSLPMEDEVLVAFESGDPHGAANALLGVHDGRDSRLAKNVLP